MSKILIKVNEWIPTSRVVFLKKLYLKYYCKPEAYFQPSQSSEMELFSENSFLKAVNFFHKKVPYTQL